MTHDANIPEIGLRSQLAKVAASEIEIPKTRSSDWGRCENGRHNLQVDHLSPDHNWAGYRSPKPILCECMKLEMLSLIAAAERERGNA